MVANRGTLRWAERRRNHTGYVSEANNAHRRLPPERKEHWGPTDLRQSWGQQKLRKCRRLKTKKSGSWKLTVSQWVALVRANLLLELLLPLLSESYLTHSIWLLPHSLRFRPPGFWSKWSGGRSQRKDLPFALETAAQTALLLRLYTFGKGCSIRKWNYQECLGGSVH